MEQHIDVCSYHLQAPPESSYSTKSTANLTPARQRIIDSVIRQRDFVPTDFRPHSNASSNDMKRPRTTTKERFEHFNKGDRCRQFIPNLYANQRVRERSNSRDPPPKLQRDLKKCVAFGRTTTIRESRSLNSIRPTTATINRPSINYPPISIPSTPPINTHAISSSSSIAKLQNEVQYLRSYVDSNDKLRKDVDQIQQILKTLIEENVELQSHVHESEKAQITTKQLQKEVQELSESNSALRTRVNLLEVWHARAKVEKHSKLHKQPVHNSIYYHPNSHSNSLNGQNSTGQSSNGQTSKTKKTAESDAFVKKKMQNECIKAYRYNNEYEACRRLAQIYVGDEDRSLNKYSEEDEDSSRDRS